jgi:hypothetical protein
MHNIGIGEQEVLGRGMAGFVNPLRNRPELAGPPRRQRRSADYSQHLIGGGSASDFGCAVVTRIVH